MKRVLYNPLHLVKSLFGGGGGGSPAPTPAAEVRSKETGSGEEASRREASDAARRQGASASLLSDPSLGSTFGSTGTKKKSLLGS